jgi:CRISPR-associated protein Cmr2
MTSYTCITFAPVQGFIEKSRKLRDLNGSSLILSFLATTICEKYPGRVITPALIDITRGVPNQIVIRGKVEKKEVSELFIAAWSAIVTICQKHIEDLLPNENYDWNREWNNCKSHSWEIFHAVGSDFDTAKLALSNKKMSRNWVGVNWKGESSSLSGADAIAWPNMCSFNPKDAMPRAEIESFFKKLSKCLPPTILDERERLSIAELIKRLLTVDKVWNNLRDNYPQLPKIEDLKSFTDVDRWKEDDIEESYWTCWFMGDGDSMGKYLTGLRNTPDKDPDEAIQEFSRSMMEWGANLQGCLPGSATPTKTINGRIVYAGGDDFLGILYSNAKDYKLQLNHCFDEFWYKFPDMWARHGQTNLTVSVGLVWAAPQIPQRNVLQHCRLAEQSAKSSGRDRLAIRILFNNGNHLEWCCPWWCLEIILTACKNWNGFYQDVATLTSRHSMSGSSSDIAIAIFKLHFGDAVWDQLTSSLWNNLDNSPPSTGILGQKPEPSDPQVEIDRINDWVISLSKVGFHIFANQS